MSDREDYLAREISELEVRLTELRTELASRVEQEALENNSVHLLVGEVAGEKIAFLVDDVSEVLAMPQTTPLPEAQPWINGLLDLHGQVIPVVDIEARATGIPRTARASDFLVVCSFGDSYVGLVINRIIRVVALPSIQLKKPPPNLPMAPYVLRVFHRGENTILLLSIERLLRTSALPGASG